MIRVAIADDHAIVRTGLRALLACEQDMVLVGEAKDGLETLELAQRTPVDVFLIDLSMPSLDGVEVIARLHSLLPRLKILVLSMHAMPEFVRPAFRAGAQGYVVKGSGLDDLVTAIRAVQAGERFLDPAAEAALQGEDLSLRNRDDAGDDLDRLTPREREILCLVAQGQTNRAIAASLGLSPKTVDSHRTNLMRKLGVHDAQGLTRFAVRKGLIGE